MGAEHYASIRIDVTARYLQEEKIRNQAKAPQSSNEKLQTFSAIAAHDLPAPLRNVCSILDFVDEDVDAANINLPPSVYGHLNDLRDQTERMAQLVEDLLQYANTSLAENCQVPVKPMKHLHNAVALISLPVGFSVSLPKQLPEIQADPTAFEAVVRNLIGNVIKHHDRDEGEVIITVTDSERFLEIHFSDDGAGIPEEFHDAIFEPFKRLS